MKNLKTVKNKFFERNRIIILFTPLVLLPVVILSLMIVLIYINKTEERSRAELQNSTILVAEEINDIFENVENCSDIINLDINHFMVLLKYEFNEKILRLKLENSIKTSLDLYKSMFSEIDCISYISTDGNVISTDINVEVPVNVDRFLREEDIDGYGDRYFVKWLDMKRFDSVTGDFIGNHISLIRPVLSTVNLENCGYLVFNICQSTIIETYDKLNNDFFIVNSDRTVVSSEDIMDDNSIFIDRKNNILKGDKDYIYERINHGDIDWYLVSELKTDIMSKEAGNFMRNMFFFIAALIIICICIGKAFSDRQIREVERRKRKYELDIMQAQIKPHFLYNALDLIYVLCAMGNSKDAAKSTKALADFYRLSLSGGDDIISLKDELLNVSNYLKIQSQRYSDKFDFEINVNKEIFDYKIPKLTLQPLVENSIYHGLKPKEEKGVLYISGKECKRFAIICVWDNGVGISDATMDMIMNRDGTRAVFGLKNVADRLDLYYEGMEYEGMENDIKNLNLTRNEVIDYCKSLPGDIDDLYIVSKHMAIQRGKNLTRVFLILKKD